MVGPAVCSWWAGPAAPRGLAAGGGQELLRDPHHSQPGLRGKVMGCETAKLDSAQDSLTSPVCWSPGHRLPICYG